MKVDFKFVPSKHKNTNILNKTIYFMHIPKSGGTTIDHIFLKLFSILKDYHFKRFKYSDGVKKNKLLINEIDISKKYFISGHLDHDFCSNLDNIYKCSIVRDPVSRVISHYKFMVFKLSSTPEKYTFEMFINNEVKNNRDNLITRHFAGLLNEKKNILDQDSKQALKNMNSFDLIYTLENWDKFLANLLSKFGLPSILYSRFQQHQYNFSYSPKEHHLNLIKKYYYYDFIIYSKILEFKNQYKIENEDEYNKKICVVSPYLKTENKLYNEQDIKNLFEKQNAI